MYLKQKELDLIKKYIWKTIDLMDWTTTSEPNLDKDVQDLLNILDERQAKDSAKAWEYIKEKRKTDPNYAR